MHRLSVVPVLRNPNRESCPHRIPNVPRLVFQSGDPPPIPSVVAPLPSSRRHARAAEREDDIHDSHDSDEAAAQSSRVQFRSHKQKGNRRRPQAKPRRARKADDESNYQAPPSTETMQNSDRDAESNESDHDEHSRLAVAFDNIQFA